MAINGPIPETVQRTLFGIDRSYRRKIGRFFHVLQPTSETYFRARRSMSKLKLQVGTFVYTQVPREILSLGRALLLELSYKSY